MTLGGQRRTLIVDYVPPLVRDYRLMSLT